MPSIGSFSFDTWGGILAYGGPKTSLFEQGGVDGYGVVFGGLKTSAQVIRTLYRASGYSDATSTIVNYRAAMLAYTPVAVIDQFGIEWDNVLILDVVGNIVVDPIGYMAVATWSLLPQSN